MPERYPPSKPYYEPHLPKRKEYRLVGSKGEEPIYRDVSVLGDREIDLKEWFEDYDETLPPEPDIRWWEKLSLQDIVDMVPPDTKLSDVIFHIDMPRHLEYIDITFSKHERDLNAEEIAYQKALERYEKDMLQYNKDLAKYKKDLDEYEEWRRKKELSELKAKIKSLSKSK